MVLYINIKKKNKKKHLLPILKDFFVEYDEIVIKEKCFRCSNCEILRKILDRNKCLLYTVLLQGYGFIYF